MFFPSIFAWFGGGFLVVFQWFFQVKISWEPRKRFRKKAYETLAMATKSRVRVLKNYNFFHIFYQKSQLFGKVDLGQIFDLFWEGFRTPKSMIFAFFGLIFQDKFRVIFWKA